MKDIKFTGKRKGEPHELLTGDLNHILGKVYIFPRGEDAPKNSTEWYEVEPETVQEHKDPRGRKPLNPMDRKVFLTCGVKEKHRKVVKKLLAEISKQYS